jgi:hypothetical protein
MIKPISLSIKDPVTDITHEFQIDTNHGVRITHVGTGAEVAMEIFEGVLRCLAYRKDSDEPVVNCILE